MIVEAKAVVESPRTVGALEGVENSDFYGEVSQLVNDELTSDKLLAARPKLEQHFAKLLRTQQGLSEGQVRACMNVQRLLSNSENGNAALQSMVTEAVLLAAYDVVIRTKSTGSEVNQELFDEALVTVATQIEPFLLEQTT